MVFITRWYAKRFLHPDIVAPYDYVFIWDEDLGLENFDAEECVFLLISIERFLNLRANPSPENVNVCLSLFCRYIRLIKKHGLEISQPAVESKKKITWEITKRKAKGEVHK